MWYARMVVVDCRGVAKKLLGLTDLPAIRKKSRPNLLLTPNQLISYFTYSAVCVLLCTCHVICIRWCVVTRNKWQSSHSIFLHKVETWKAESNCKSVTPYYHVCKLCNTLGLFFPQKRYSKTFGLVSQIFNRRLPLKPLLGLLWF